MRPTSALAAVRIEERPLDCMPASGSAMEQQTETVLLGLHGADVDALYALGDVTLTECAERNEVAAALNCLNVVSMRVLLIVFGLSLSEKLQQSSRTWRLFAASGTKTAAWVQGYRCCGRNRIL